MKPEQQQAARGAVVGAWRKFGTAAFRVDLRGRHAGPLKDAEKLGLCWWPGDDRCALLPRGVEIAAEYAGGNGSEGR